MIRGLSVALFGVVFAQYQVTQTKSSSNEVEFGGKAKDKDAKTSYDTRMRLRTTTDDKTLEFEAEARSVADKTKVHARTRFNVRDVYTYADTNANGLLDGGENFTKYDLQWGPITCSSTSSPYTCALCNSGGLPSNALCFDFAVTDVDIKLYNRTVRPTQVKIGMDWNPASVPLAVGDRIAIVGRFRSSSTFKDRKAVALAIRSGSEEEDEQPSSDGSGVKWEKRVFSPLGTSSELKVGAFIPGGGVTDGTEKDDSDGSSMSFRQLQFNFVGAAPFTWDPDIYLPPNGVAIAVPSMLAFLTFLVLA